MPPKNVDDIYALSPMQLLMLVRAQSDPTSSALVNQVVYDVRGPLSEPCLREAWQTVVARHPALRTAFLWDGLDRPVQVVRSSVDPRFRTVDLGRGLRRERAFAALAKEELEQPFVLQQAPLVRSSLVRLGAEHHRFVLTVHHLVLDRWSYGSLIEELAACYGSCLAGEPVELPPPPAFRSYIAWLQDQDPKAARRFWKEELRALPPTVGVGVRANGKPDTGRGTLRLPLPPEVEAAAWSRASEWRTTPASILTVGVALALARRRRSRDVVFGVTAAGRPPQLPGVDRAVGSFVNNVPLRVRLTPDEPLSELVRGVQRAQTRRQLYEHVSPAQMQVWADRPGSEPLFDTLLLMNLDAPADPGWPEGLTFEPMSATLDAGTPVLLALVREDSGIVLQVVHQSGIERVPEIAKSLIESIHDVARADPDALVSEVLPDELATSETGLRADETHPGENHDGESQPAPTVGRPEEAGGDLSIAVMEIWRQVLAVDYVDLDDDFFEVGGTSLQAIELFARLERLLGRSLPVSILFRSSSVQALLAELDQTGSAGPVIGIRTLGDHAPVFAAPGIDGQVLGLARVAWALGADYPFFGLEPKGFDGKSAPLESVEELAEYFLPGVIREAAGRPVHLVGVCFGSFVVFELAKRLRAASVPVLSVSLLEPGIVGASEIADFDGDATALYTESSTSGILIERMREFRELFSETDWRGRLGMIGQKVKRAAEIVRERGLGDEIEAAMERARAQLPLVQASGMAIAAYRPEVTEARCRVFIAEDHNLRGMRDWRMDWLGLFHPEPDLVPLPGRSVADTMASAGFARALRTWLDENRTS